MRISVKRLCSAAGFTAEHFQNYLKGTKNFENILNTLNIVNLGKGKCTAELEIEERHTNILGTLHGGLTATLVDVVSSYGLTTLHDRGETPHVSVNLNVRYIKGAHLGKTIIIDSELVRCGRSLAFLEVTIKDKESGVVLAKGEHTKYLLN